MPVVRNEAAPTSAAKTPLAIMAMIAANHQETISLLIRMHETYTPVAKYKAWPNDNSPVNPKSRSYVRARAPQIKATAIVCCRPGMPKGSEVNSGAIARTISKRANSGREYFQRNIMHAPFQVSLVV